MNANLSSPSDQQPENQSTVESAESQQTSLESLMNLALPAELAKVNQAIEQAMRHAEAVIQQSLSASYQLVERAGSQLDSNPSQSNLNDGASQSAAYPSTTSTDAQAGSADPYSALGQPLQQSLQQPVPETESETDVQIVQHSSPDEVQSATGGVSESFLQVEQQVEQQMQAALEAVKQSIAVAESHLMGKMQSVDQALQQAQQTVSQSANADAQMQQAAVATTATEVQQKAQMLAGENSSMQTGNQNGQS